MEHVVHNLKAGARWGVGFFLRWEHVVVKALFFALVAWMKVFVGRELAESEAIPNSYIFCYIFFAVLLSLYYSNYSVRRMNRGGMYVVSVFVFIMFM